MKKITIYFISILILFSASSLKADLKQDMNKEFLKSLGYSVGEVAGIPTEEVAKVATALGNYDLKTAFLTLASYVTDNALNAIPIYGPAKFLADLGTRFGNLLNSYMKSQYTIKVWNKFLQLNNTLKQRWLNGEYVGDIDDYYDLYYKKFIPDKSKLISTIRTAWEDYKKKQKQAKVLMSVMAKITKVIKQAKEKTSPDLYMLQNSQKIKIGTPIEIWKSKNNYFIITLFTPEGNSVPKRIKEPSKSTTFKIKLSDFSGIDWNKLFEKYPEGVPVTLNIKAGVYDTTGLMKKYMPDLVSPKENIVAIPGYPVSENAQFRFTVIPEIQQISCQKHVSGPMSLSYSIPNYGSDVYRLTGETNLKYTCSTEGEASLNLDDQITLKGKCTQDGIGKFTWNTGYGSLVLYLTVSCDPVSLTFYSTGSFKQTENCGIVREDGSCAPLSIIFSNYKGSFK